jgi:hypothetical protein
MSRLQRYFLLLAVLWAVGMCWRLGPQFGEAVRIDGRVTTLGEFLADQCGERVGPAAVTCQAEAGAEGARLLRREQGKSVLLAILPLLAWLVVEVARSLASSRIARESATPPA